MSAGTISAREALAECSPGESVPDKTSTFNLASSDAGADGHWFCPHFRKERMLCKALQGWTGQPGVRAPGPCHSWCLKVGQGKDQQRARKPRKCRTTVQA
jgi:hypothetical protein